MRRGSFVAGARGPGRLPLPWAILALLFVAVCAYAPQATMLLDAWREQGPELLRTALSVATEERRLGLISRSVLIAAATTLGCVLLGVPYALWVTRTDLRFRRLLRILVMVPLFVPSYVFALGWRQVFDRAGPLAEWLGGLGVAVPDAASPWGVVLVLTCRFFPLVALVAASGFDHLEPGLEEAGRISHGLCWVVSRITVPLVWPPIVASGLLIFNLTLVNYTVPSLLRVPTFPVEIFAAYSGLLDTATAVALSLPLMAVAALAVILSRAALGERAFLVNPVPERHVVLWRWDRWAPLGGLPCLALLVLSAGLPVAAVAGVLQGSADVSSAYGAASEQVWRTLGLAAAAATLLTLHGVLAGYLVARSRGPRSVPVDLVFFLPLAFAPTTLGIGMIRLWNHPHTEWLMASPAIIVLAFCGQFAPFATAPIAAAMARIPRQLEEAAWLAGMGWPARARHVLLPLAGPGIVAGWLLTFSLCLDEIGASILVLPPDSETLAVRIYNLSHYDARETVAGLCLLVLLILAVAGAVGAGLLRLRRRFEGARAP